MKRTLFLSVITLIAAWAMTNPAEAQNRHGRAAASKRPAHHVVARQAHVHYSGMPHWGASIHAIPPGAVSIRYRNRPYYYHNGVYFAPRSGGYAVVRPVRGIRVTVLPMGYRTVVIGPRNYFYYYGTFYRPSSGGYVVVNPPVGAVVDSLPEGYSVATVGGVEYYVLDGITYAEVDAPEFPDGIGYEVISS